MSAHPDPNRRPPAGSSAGTGLTRRRFGAVVTGAVLAGAGAGCFQRQKAARPVAWPGAAWQSVPAADAGFDSQRLGLLEGFLGGAGCLTRHGRVVHHWGKWRQASDVASAAKPVLTLLLLKAVELGRLPSVDALVADSEPALADLNASLGHKDRRMTWRHLANQTSCYGAEEGPGTAFDYNDHQTALFYDVLLGKVFGVAAPEATGAVLAPYLTGPLACEDAPVLVGEGDKFPLGRLKISPRDFCRIGLMVVRGGLWGDRRVLEADPLRRTYTDPLPLNLPRASGRPAAMLPGRRTYGGGANQEDHRGSYSWMWWINGLDQAGARLFPHAPADAFGAFGYGGSRALVMLPGLDIVASWTRGALPKVPMCGKGRDHMDRAFRLLLESLQRDGTGS